VEVVNALRNKGTPESTSHEKENICVVG